MTKPLSLKQQREQAAEKYRPAVKGQADKYSWKLYQRMLKRGLERVYISSRDNVFGEQCEPPSLEKLAAGDSSQARRLMIGERYDFDGQAYFAGRQLRSALHTVGRNSELSYGPGNNVEHWLDVTDWFWPEYERIGRCLFDNYAHMWLTINKNARKCAYCGAHQRRSVETYRKIIRKEIWS